MTKRSVFLTLAIGIAVCSGCSGTAGTEEERSPEVDSPSKIAQMNSAVFVGRATKRGGNTTQIKLSVAGCTQLTGMSVDLGTPFSGIYDSAAKSAEVMVDQVYFNSLSSRLSSGAVSITLSVGSSGVVTRFCNAGTCIP